MNVKGTLIVKNDTQQVSEKYAKRDFVVKTAGEYPQEIQLQLSQDKCSLIDKFAIGTELDCSINLRGRSWFNPTKNITQYFNTIEAWKIEPIGATQQPQPEVAKFENGQIVTATVQQPEQPKAEILDDLPF